ncbi:MAG: Hsp20 family protein, partial [Pseudomonadota bacterium]
MRTVDLTPLYRSSVGFDRMASLLDAMLAQDGGGAGYPPYNIEKTGETDYRITLAVAGFRESDIAIETKGGELVISGSKPEKADADDARMLHRGIAERAFERRFKLA